MTIYKPRYSLFFLGLIILIMIVFETLQQRYYIETFQPQLQIGFFTLLKNQLIKWLVWLFLSVFLNFFVKKLSRKNHIQLFDLFKLFLLIIVLIFVGIFIMSLIGYFISDIQLSLSKYLSDSMVFFAYQKTPIYTLAYICFSVIIYFYYINLRLKIEISNFGLLKIENRALYEKLNVTYQDKAAVLKIKVGNSYKIIAINDIFWLQADDYCVNVHMHNNNVYSLRKSLKSLEDIMPTNFLRVHRSAIVNMEIVDEIQSNGIISLLLKNGDIIAISKSRTSQVKHYFSQLKKTE